jgi:membrane protein DedA with SNARE-associated domain
MESILAFLQSLQGAPAYALVFGVLVGSGFGLPVNEDLLLMVAAALTLRGVMEPLPLVAVAWCGILCADALIFHWGHRFGAPLLRHPRAGGLLPPHRLQAVQARLQRWGPVCLAAVRFAPGLRTALLFAAGSLKMRYAHLLLYDGLAGLVEIPLLVWGVRAVGGNWQAILATVQQWQGVLVPLVLLVLAVGGLTWWWRRRRRR